MRCNQELIARSKPQLDGSACRLTRSVWGILGRPPWFTRPSRGAQHLVRRHQHGADLIAWPPSVDWDAHGQSVRHASGRIALLASSIGHEPRAQLEVTGPLGFGEETLAPAVPRVDVEA